ncbi:MAG: lactate utilization protein [Dorea sp.]|nr:lactate utilization protein [Dorea sp.]
MSFDIVKKNLEKKGYVVNVFETAGQASDYLNQVIDQKTVGFGGSVTLEEMGLYESLSTHNECHWHHRIPEGKTRREVLLTANDAEIYLSSVNGLSEDGEIINIDNTGNRVAAIFFGKHSKVYLVIGKNKLAADYDSAVYRARNIAGPLNARRLNRKTPCAVKADRCYNCSSPDRICRGLCALWEKPGMGEFEIILINEDMGY